MSLRRNKVVLPVGVLVLGLGVMWSLKPMRKDTSTENPEIGTPELPVNSDSGVACVGEKACDENNHSRCAGVFFLEVGSDFPKFVEFSAIVAKVEFLVDRNRNELVATTPNGKLVGQYVL